MRDSARVVLAALDVLGLELQCVFRRLPDCRNTIFYAAPKAQRAACDNQIVMPDVRLVFCDVLLHWLGEREGPHGRQEDHMLIAGRVAGK